jgi:hypothetical protein
VTSGDGLLRLTARDAADLSVVSSMLQDALVPPSDMAWLPAERRFVMAVNRYRWETAEMRERVHAGISFENVERVRRRDFAAARRGAFLNLLSITFAERGADAPAAVVLTFAGGAAIRLETTSLLCHLEDFGEPWPAQWRPGHPAA